VGQLLNVQQNIVDYVGLRIIFQTNGVVGYGCLNFLNHVLDELIICVTTIYKHGFTLESFHTLFILAIHMCVFSLSSIGTMSFSLRFHSHLACIAPKFHIDSCGL